MTYEELKIKLDIYDPEDVLKSVGKLWHKRWFVVCDEGDCHLFKEDGTEDDIRKVNRIVDDMIPDIKKIIIPDSVTNIGNSAFWCCKKLTYILIPNTVFSIGISAFAGCNSLTNVTIPDSVLRIWDYAFYCCSKLTNVKIGNSVTCIGRYTFDNCLKLKSLVFKGKTMNEVKVMYNYPWGIKDESIIRCY